MLLTVDMYDRTARFVMWTVTETIAVSSSNGEASVLAFATTARRWTGDSAQEPCFWLKNNRSDQLPNNCCWRSTGEIHTHNSGSNHRSDHSHVSAQQFEPVVEDQRAIHEQASRTLQLHDSRSGSAGSHLVDAGADHTGACDKHAAAVDLVG